MLFFVTPLVGEPVAQTVAAIGQSMHSILTKVLGEDSPVANNTTWLQAGQAYDSLKGMGRNSASYTNFADSSHIWG